MRVSVVSRSELKLVGLKVVGRRSELSHRVPLAWLELVQRLPAIAHRVEPGVFYGVFPERDHQQGSADGVYTYWVGTEVSAFFSLPEGLVSLTIPAGDYATARVEGTAEAIDATYLGLARWVEEHGRHPAPAGYGLERYEELRQKVTPPYERFDYDVFKPLEDA